MTGQKSLEKACHGRRMLPKAHVVVGQTRLRQMVSGIAVQDPAQHFPLLRQLRAVPRLPAIQRLHQFFMQSPRRSSDAFRGDLRLKPAER